MCQNVDPAKGVKGVREEREGCLNLIPEPRCFLDSFLPLMPKMVGLSSVVFPSGPLKRSYKQQSLKEMHSRLFHLAFRVQRSDSVQDPNTEFAAQAYPSSELSLRNCRESPDCDLGLITVSTVKAKFQATPPTKISRSFLKCEIFLKG